MLRAEVVRQRTILVAQVCYCVSCPPGWTDGGSQHSLRNTLHSQYTMNSLYMYSNMQFVWLVCGRVHLSARDVCYR